MLPHIMKPKDAFVYIQVEATELIFHVFRYEERAHDAVLLRTEGVQGDFRNIEALIPVLSGYIGKAQKLAGCRVIVGLHSGLCATTQTTVTLRRTNPQQVIDEAELENLVSSGLWKIFSRDQQEFARTFRVADSAVTLMSAQVSQVRINGHRVISPVGFPAHTIELSVIYTVTPRMLYELFAPLLLSEQSFYLTEIGMSELLWLTEQKPEEHLMLIRVSEVSTYISESLDGELGTLDTINWGRKSFITALVNELMVSEAQAVELLRRAEANLVSPHVRRRIEGLLLEEVSVLLKGIGAHVREREVKSVYIAAPFSLPEALFTGSSAKRSGIPASIIPLPSISHSEKTESALPLSMKPSTASPASLCANAWAATRSFIESDLQKMAKRRTRWLANSQTK